ncbi:MAG TPA: I78 family peptidase inhibitor [Sphingomicrobium sp.]|nr:I78 family peptidase inhibitor [Sphingomicrobium sp.]
MLRIVLIAPALLTACATAPAAQPGPPATGESGHVCRNEGLGVFAGREATDEVGAEILRVSGARHLRWVRPGMMVTMEFREDRVTVWLAAGNRVERVSCG